MKLKTKELKLFLMTCGQIKPNPVATNLDSIKIECVGNEIIFTKTNNNIWCKYSYVCQPQPPEIYLINERMLHGIAITSKEYEIDISLHIDGINILIVSGEDVVKTGLQDLKLFPPIQEATGEKIRITKENVERIMIAGKYVNTSPVRTALNFVHVGINGIFASNGNILYYYKSENLPEVFFDQEPMNTINASDDIFYWTSESYDFFQLEGFTFGFIKSIVKGIPYLPMVQATGEIFFNCKREDFLDFCTLIQYSKRQENPLAIFKGTETVLSLIFNDADFNIGIVRNIPIQGNAPIEDFRFNVEHVSSMLKSLKYNNIVLTKLADGHYGVTTDEDQNYKGIIARLA